MKTSTFVSTVAAAQAALVAGKPLSTRQSSSCPDVHIFGARETTVSQGFGSAGTVVDLITAQYSGATSEAIVYPACGGQSSCGGIAYGDSVNNGTNAVTEAVNSFAESCPDSQIVLVGYSQGGQIMDNAFCGGGDTSAGITDTSVPLSDAAVSAIKAAIFMGDPRYVAGLSYNVGTCESGGVSCFFFPFPAAFRQKYVSCSC